MDEEKTIHILLECPYCTRKDGLSCITPHWLCEACCGAAAQVIGEGRTQWRSSVLTAEREPCVYKGCSGTMVRYDG